MKLFVGNLTTNTTEGEIRDMFEPFGPVLEITRPFNRETGQPRAFAFVQLTEADKGTEAMKSLDGMELNGRTLKVNEAEERGHSAPDPFYRPRVEKTKKVDDRPIGKDGKRVVYKGI